VDALTSLLKTDNIVILVLLVMLGITLRVSWQLYRDNQKSHEQRHNDLKESSAELRELSSTMVGAVKDHTTAVASLEVVVRERIGR